MGKDSIRDAYETLTAKIKAEEINLTEMLLLLKSIDPEKLDKPTIDAFNKVLKNAESIKASLSKELDYVDMIYETAIVDSQTNLRNRRYFDEFLKQEFERVTNLSYLMIDIDNFKQYNDRFGHQQGDKAISAVAGLIRDTISERDTAIRYGGEEFSVILVGYHDPYKQAYNQAEKIRQGMESMVITPFSDKAMIDCFLEQASDNWTSKDIVNNSLAHFFSDSEINSTNYADKLDRYFRALSPDLQKAAKSYIAHLQRITVSIGCAVRIEDESIDQLINRADNALYKAKETKNKVVMSR